MSKKRILDIEENIYLIRDKQVMLDKDLAQLYQVETKILNQAVKRNIERFPERFMFQLTLRETGILKSQSVTSSWGGARKLPFVFTEQGVSMLSAVLKSTIAVKISLQLMDAFVKMRSYFRQNGEFLLKFQQIDQKIIEHDTKFDKLFQKIHQTDSFPKKGIFYEGQMFQAHKFILNLLKTSKISIILIDNYIDEMTLDLFTDSNSNITIYTKNISKKLLLSVDKFNSQYDNKIKVKEFTKSHDRYIIIDEKELYHFGASLKDLGKKWFSFSKLDLVTEVLKKLN